MNLIANGRLTDFGALFATLVITVVVFWVVIAKAYRDEPESFQWPPAARREARRLADAADLDAANEAGH